MNQDYYKKRREEAPCNALIVIGCMLLAALIIAVAWMGTK